MVFDNSDTLERKTRSGTSDFSPLTACECHSCHLRSYWLEMAGNTVERIMNINLFLSELLHFFMPCRALNGSMKSVSYLYRRFH